MRSANPRLDAKQGETPLDPEEMDPTELQTRIFAGQLLTLGAQKGSASLDAFSGWLLAGFGAGFALLLANLDSVLTHLALWSLRGGILLFLISVAFALSAKLLAAFVASGAGAAAEAGELGRRLEERNIDIDFRQMFREIEAAVVWPGSIGVKKIFAKAAAGDFAVAARMHAKASQLQGLAVLAQVLASVAAGAVLICGLGV